MHFDGIEMRPQDGLVLHRDRAMRVGDLRYSNFGTTTTTTTTTGTGKTTTGTTVVPTPKTTTTTGTTATGSSPRQRRRRRRLCTVSKKWNQSFCVIIAQRRWDHLTQSIANDKIKEWLYHRLSYIPPGVEEDETGSIPREGCIRIFRSHCKKVCDDAMTEYRNNRQKDQYSGFDRAHREIPEWITLALPQQLPWTSAIHCVNEIMSDERPRLVSKFTGSIGDINAMAEGKSREG